MVEITGGGGIKLSDVFAALWGAEQENNNQTDGVGLKYSNMFLTRLE